MRWITVNTYNVIRGERERERERSKEQKVIRGAKLVRSYALDNRTRPIPNGTSEERER